MVTLRYVAYSQAHKIAAAQFTVNCKVKQG
jgi:hypothetical protein